MWAFIIPVKASTRRSFRRVRPKAGVSHVRRPISCATSTLGRRDIERVHAGPRTGFPHDRSGAADMIRVAVSKNCVLELIWRTAASADRPEGGGLLTWETGVDQCQSVVARDQEGV
jgi:hypothetical protein